MVSGKKAAERQGFGAELTERAFAADEVLSQVAVGSVVWTRGTNRRRVCTVRTGVCSDTGCT